MRLRAEFATLSVLFVVVCLWLTVGSQQFLRAEPVSYRSLDGEIVGTWHRETPFGSVWAAWNTECQSLITGIERRDSGIGFYQRTDGLVSYEVRPPVALCFADGGEVRVTHKWQVRLFNIIPLRPFVLEYTTATT